MKKKKNQRREKYEEAPFTGSIINIAKKLG